MDVLTYVAIGLGFLMTFGLVIATGFIGYIFVEAISKRENWEFTSLTGGFTLFGIGMTVAAVLTMIEICRNL